MWKLIISSRAQKQLSKMDKQTLRILIAWMKKNLVDCDDPFVFGKPLKGKKFSGLWRYRVGNYRILCLIQNEKLEVHAVEIAHRKDIY